MAPITDKTLDIRFSSDVQAKAYWARDRNQLSSGGFNNGKSFGYCLKSVTLLSTFSKYRFVIARQVRADLMKTTYQTFFKICPKDFIASQNLQDGVTYLKNDSRVDWMHLDGIEDSTLRGLEINSVFTDQAEECSEKVYDILDSRIGRWDEAIVPDEYLSIFPDWPCSEMTGRPIVPSYHLNACNPDTQFHHLYRHYHPDSPDRLPNHFYVENAWDTKLGSKESYANALRHDEEWRQKYLLGQWGVSNAQIHRVRSSCLLEYDANLFDRILSKGALYRVLDHGDSSPTCCLWFAVLDGVYICYREYYSPGKLISYHRQAINELSGNEKYVANYADPSIFKQGNHKDGAFWTIADEYITSALTTPPLTWQPADNNEHATRNRINELLTPNLFNRHPINKVLADPEGNPALYFIKRDPVKHPYGCVHAIKETGSQRRELIGYYEGKALYSDEREKSVVDHSYDCVRYFVAMHGTNTGKVITAPPRNSIKFYKTLLKIQASRSPRPRSG